ncbi:MAG: hypothetical protein PUP92_21960 [Rhizonema sp. PD38]|nr:hypothetical protein [Rhizonema sp. PD38]
MARQRNYEPLEPLYKYLHSCAEYEHIKYLQSGIMRQPKYECTDAP